MIIISLAAVMFYFRTKKPKDYSDTFFSLDTIVSLKMSENITQQTKEKIKSFDGIFDMYSEQSELYQLNQNRTLDCSYFLTDIINKTIRLNSLYGRRLDISSGKLNALWHEAAQTNVLPDQKEIEKSLADISFENIHINENLITLENDISIDLGAVAKGYVLDTVYPSIVQSTPKYAFVSLGSSTLLYSNDADYRFNVVVKSGHDSQAGTVVTGPCFVSTSGDYERYAEIGGVKYHHIIDLKTGFPADSGLSSVTVFCDSGLLSDFLSTLIFIEGKENLQKHLTAEKYKIVAIDTEGKVFKSESLDFHES